MSVRYVLAPEAARDLAHIWRYIKQQSSMGMADHVESVIRDKIIFRKILVPDIGART
jgi:plasmid stabilization system protein ParE